jgi:hypothetical protein
MGNTYRVLMGNLKVKKHVSIDLKILVKLNLKIRMA